MEMKLFTAKAMRHPRLANPTIIVITDRTELDNQLSDRSHPAHCCQKSRRRWRVGRRCVKSSRAEAHRRNVIHNPAEVRADQDEKAAGQKHPLLSDRRNIIAIV